MEDFQKNQEENNTYPGVSNPYEAPEREQLTVLPDGTQPVSLGSGVITSILGEGGAAIIYEILIERLGISRAVKLLRPNAKPESLKRFETEMKILAQLKHPNVVEIHAVGEWNGLSYIEMEKINGVSLDRLIEKRGALPFELCLAIGLYVARALLHTHNHEYRIDDRVFLGVLHRDLKPPNIMLDRDGTVKLMDFGIATPTEASIHTSEGDIVGSLQYLAPEQLRGEKATPATDVYSFGLVMYEMLTGTKAFGDLNMATLVPSRLRNSFKPLSGFKLKIPKSFERFINSCVSLDPKKRPSSFKSVLQQLQKMYVKRTAMKPKEVILQCLLSDENEKKVLNFRRKPPYLLILLFLLGGGFGAWGVFYLWQINDRNKKEIDALKKEKEQVISVQGRQVQPVIEKDRSKRNDRGKAKRSVPSPKKEITSERIKKRLLAAEPEPKVVVKKEVEKSPLQILKEKNGTTDLKTILAAEIEQRNYENALLVYDSLPLDVKKTLRATLYRLRALSELKNSKDLAQLFRSDYEDCEFTYNKALFYFRQGFYERALALFKKSLNQTCLLANQQEIIELVTYYTAMSLTNLYRQKGSSELKQKALDSWFNVKFSYKNRQDHPHFLEANKQIRFLSSAE